MPTINKTKKPFLNLLIIIGSLLVFILAIEGMLRATGFNPFGEFFENEGRAIFIRPSNNPLRVYEATPHAVGSGWGTDISINSLGFRGREYSLNKPIDTYRIIVIGDSIAFGNNLPADKNFPFLLEKQYASAGKKVEVLNLSLGGYDTLQEVATLEEIGLALQPDKVILAYCINDIGVASGNANYVQRLQKYGAPIYHLRFAQWVRIQLDRIELIRHTENANKNDSFSEMYKNSLADINTDPVLVKKMQALADLLQVQPNKYPFTHDYTKPVHLQRLRFSLEKLKRLQEQERFQVEALIIPFLGEDAISQPVYQAVYDIVQYEMQRLNIPTIALHSEFTKIGLSSLILKQGDSVHPNATGHQLMADTLYKIIELN